jgi:DNA sulfur modification protein DndE
MINLNPRGLRLSRRGILAGVLSASALPAGVLPSTAAFGEEECAEPTAKNNATGTEAWLSGLALQAATYAAPIVAMYNLRDTTSVGASAKVAPNEIWRMEDIASPAIAEQSGYVTPNVNVIYGFGFMDLKQQPIILHAPDSHGRYYMIEICDMWANAFAYIGGTATGYKGGTYALVGPGWRGHLPQGVKRIDCPTRWVELQPRVHVKNHADLAAAQEVLRTVTVKGLAQHNGSSAPAALAYRYDTPKINPKVASSQMQFLDPLQFWEIFSAAMNENPPPPSEIKSVLPQFMHLGIELNKPWSRESVPPPILDQMKQASSQIGPMMMPLLPILGKTSNGWNIPPANIGMPGADFPARALVAVFGLTSNTTVEAIYYTSVADAAGQKLTGAKRYALTFKDSMQCIKAVAPGFWSITIYDSATGFTVPNTINRYALGSDDELKRNPDDSFTLYVQHDDPGPEHQSNWLPTPAGPFYAIIRVYAPAPEVAAGLKSPKTFEAPPAIVPIA